MIKKIFNDRSPGWVGEALLIVITSFWCFWSVGEMYYEGWWGSLTIRLAYLIPGTAFLMLTLIGIRWPRLGGWLIIVIGGLFTLFFLDIDVVDGNLTMGRDLTGFLVSGPLVFLGILLLVDGRSQRRRIARGWVPHPTWWRRNIWRMPTVDEYARSFARHGENAGCMWPGEGHDRMVCEILPDKETPLWAPDLDPIYYWAAEEYDDREAYFVSYNGRVNTAYKSGSNPRHSHRCVRDPQVSSGVWGLKEGHYLPREGTGDLGGVVYRLPGPPAPGRWPLCARGNRPGGRADPGQVSPRNSDRTWIEVRNSGRNPR
jgi:hypothetical protein